MEPSELGRRRRRAPALAGCAAIAAASALVLAGPLEGVEKLTVDARFGIRGEQPAPRDVVLVAIDDESLDVLTQRSFRFDRRLHAQAIRALGRAGVRVIAYDVDFTEPADLDEISGPDLALAEAIDEARAIVLARTDPEADLFGTEGAARELGARLGMALFDVDSRFGTVREAPAQVEGARSFAWAAADLFGGKPVARQVEAGDHQWIDFAGPPDTVVRIPFWQVVRGRAPRSALAGKAAVVGVTIDAAQDTHRTSAGGGLMPGAEIQANAIATVLAGFPLRDSPDGTGLLLVLGAALLAPGLALRLSAIWLLALSATALAALLAGAQLLFGAGTVIPVVAPALALVLGAVGATAVLYRLEIRERRRVRAAFARFVPDAVVERALERAGEDLRLPGESGVASVLFCDLRGSTAAAERLPAAEVISAIDVFLTEMGEAVLAHGGTIAGYRGDGLMAVWGAPVAQDDHADAALAAGLEMLSRLDSVNARIAGRFGGPMRMGVGINTGEVAAGTVGPLRRLEFAAVGDATNTAARLEALTKEAGRPLVLAAATVAALTRGVPEQIEPIGTFEIRGRREPLECWGLKA